MESKIIKKAGRRIWSCKAFDRKTLKCLKENEPCSVRGKCLSVRIKIDKLRLVRR